MTESSNEQANTPEITDLPADDLLGLLAVERRWLALEVLEGEDSPVELEELAAGIAAREDGTDADDEDAIDRVATTLYHVHLPKLADAGLLDYDPESHRIDPAGGSTGRAPDPPSSRPKNWFAAVADKHRQLVLEVLAEDERTTLEELSSTLADADAASIDAPADAIATRLHHNHLPRLDDLGYVRYDPDTHVVEATDRIADLLDVARRA